MAFKLLLVHLPFKNHFCLIGSNNMPYDKRFWLVLVHNSCKSGFQIFLRFIITTSLPTVINLESRDQVRLS